MVMFAGCVAVGMTMMGPVCVNVGKRAIWAGLVNEGPIDVGGQTAMALVLAGATELDTAPVADAGKIPAN